MTIKGVTIHKKIAFKYNEHIRGDFVKVIDGAGKMLGTFALKRAITMAKRENLDLVQISIGNSGVAICKILDSGKYKYTMVKKSQQEKKNSKRVETKEIKLRATIDNNDLLTKLNKATNILKSGGRVKVSLLFKGREIYNEEHGRKVIASFRDSTLSFAKVESDIKKEGRQIFIILTPRND